MSAAEHADRPIAWRHPGDAPLVATDVSVELPDFPIRPFAYYRLDMATRGKAPSYWLVDFHDADGQRIYSDNCSQLPASRDWHVEQSVFMGRARAASGKVIVRGISEPVDIRDVSVTPLSKAEAVAWCDAFYGTLPPIALSPPPDRWRHLSRTREKLATGNPLRMVVLGDSVANDMVNSQPQLLIERMWPGSEVLLVHSMEPEKGCSGYQQNNRIEPYVVRYNPDLLVIAGMSFGADTGPVINVIRQVRERMPEVDVVVAVASVTDLGNNDPKSLSRFFAELRDVGDCEGFGGLDIRTPWVDYVAGCGQPEDWFKRDSHHANDRGKHVMGRIFASFFTP